MLRTEPLKLGETGLQGFDVKFALKREMVELMLDLEQFKLEERIDGCEKVVGLRPDRVGRRASQPCVGLDGFMKDLDVPPFLVDCRDAAVVEQEVA